MPQALVLFQPELVRSVAIARALHDGFRAARWGSILLSIRSWYPGFPPARRADTVAAYGWRLIDRTRAHYARFVYVDLGWWNRKPDADQVTGHHRITVGARYEHPLELDFPGDRFDALGVAVKPWRGGPARRVLVAGMSSKCARFNGLEPYAWELGRCVALTGAGLHPVYRPKVSDVDRGPLAGVEYSDPLAEGPEQALAGVDAVVTHHSNMAVDALVEGIPAYREVSPSAPFLESLDVFERPSEPAARLAYLRALAYRQWTPAEIRRGRWLRHYPELAG